MGHMEHDMLALRKIKQECEDVIGENIDILYWHIKGILVRIEWIILQIKFKLWKWNIKIIKYYQYQEYDIKI